MRLPPRWVVSVSFAVAAAILGDSLMYAVLPTMYGSLGLKIGMVGILLSVNRFVRLASNPLAGWVVARVGVRGPFVIAVFAAALTTATYGLGLGFAVFLIARAGWGVCWSFLRLGGYLAALDSADDKSRGYYLGFFNGVTRFGSFISVLVGGFMTDIIGFTETVYIFALLTVIGGLLVLRERPPDRASEAMIANAVATKPHGNQHVDRLSTRQRRRLGVVSGGAFVQAMAVQGLVTATLGLWLQRQYGDEYGVFFIAIGVASLTGMLLSTRFLFDVLWGPVAGHLSDRHGRITMLLITGSVEAVALICLAFAIGVVWTVVVSIVLFLAATAVKVTLDAAAGDIAPAARRSQTMSWYATWSDFGAAAGPLIGYIIGVGLGLQWLYAGSALLLVCIGLVLWREYRSPMLSTATAPGNPAD